MRWAERRWGENLGAPRVQLALTVDRAGFEPFRVASAHRPPDSWILAPGSLPRSP